MKVLIQNKYIDLSLVTSIEDNGSYVVLVFIGGGKEGFNIKDADYSKALVITGTKIEVEEWGRSKGYQNKNDIEEQHIIKSFGNSFDISDKSLIEAAEKEEQEKFQQFKEQIVGMWTQAEKSDLPKIEY